MPMEASAAASTPSAAPLLRMLAGVRRRARVWICVESAAWLALATAATFWGTLLFDRAVEPPAWVRAAALACGAAALAWIATRTLARRLAAPLPDELLARAVERTHPAFRDSLATAVEFAARRSGPAATGVDPELVERTTAAAVALVDAVRPERLFRRRALARLACFGGLAAATLLGLASARPDVVGHWSRRMLRLDDDPWPRRVSLRAEGFTDGVLTVARGADVDVVVRATAAKGPPELVELRSRTAGATGAWRTSRMGSRGDGGGFGHVLAGVAADTELEVRGGDARLRGLRLRVVEPPAVAEVAIDYEPPAYVGGGPRRAAAGRIVRIPRGSRVRLAVTASKPLASGRIAAVVGDTRGGDAAPADRAVDQLPESTDAAPTRTLTATIDPLVADTTVTARFTDTDGIAPREPLRFVIEAVPDEPPRLSLRLGCISTAVTPRARLPLEGSIVDDHGLADAAVRMERVTAAGTTAAPTGAVRTPIRRVRHGAAAVEFTAAEPEWLPLEPFALAVGERIEVGAEARDTCTLDAGPQLGTSDTWTLEVVAPETLQGLLATRETLLRRRFETAAADLARARRRLDEPEALAAQPPGDIPRAAVARAGEAAARVGGETAEVAAAFRQIRGELDHNGLLTAELEARLIGQIAVPLEGLAGGLLPGLAKSCGRADASASALAPQFDEALARMRAVLDRMVELESFNEVLQRLRAMIRDQESIRDETMSRQKQRGREALESP